MFSCEYREIFKINYSEEHQRTAAIEWGQIIALVPKTYKENPQKKRSNSSNLVILDHHLEKRSSNSKY